MLRLPPRSTLFPTRRSSDLLPPCRFLVRRQAPAAAGACRYRVTALVIPRGASDHSGKAVISIREDRYGNVTNPPPERRSDSIRSEEHTSELQSHVNLVCRLL